VLVTHQIHLLPYFDKIIVMEAGQVKAFGEYYYYLCCILLYCVVLYHQ